MKEGEGWSLRRSILAIVLAITVSIWGFSGIVVYIEADQESQELFDQSLAETAHLLLTLADHEAEERLASTADTLTESNVEKHSQYLLLQIWDTQKRLLYRNNAAPETPLTTDTTSGFGWTQLNGQPWRTYSIWNAPHRLQIQIAEPISHRKDISGRFAYKLLLFAVLVLPLMAGAIWWMINRLFRALQHSADQVSQRTPNDLEKVDLAGAPVELHSLLTALNHLFERVSHAMEQEQRFTANASHELRTPLAAIKANLQVIQRARNDQERDEAAAGLLISVDRATRLVGQLMTLSKLDPQDARDPALQTYDLQQFLAKQVAEFTSIAEKKQLHLLSDLQAASCLMNPDTLAIMLRNLIDNAVRYTPAGGQIELACGSVDGRAFLRVSDSGPGIPAEMREKVFERFFRLPSASASGSGLGLSIVKSIVRSHDAQLELGEAAGQGLIVTVWLAS
ncbi:sensor histidine kinase N-terminal domain-containing protein [Undibacterium amnicola]|uniref:histidine kinase n=2 Tax=Undibacterium amnicola TaxID=1834038 RepID=A0ABR6XQP3_9BURK|nr:sensor histidine kinase N-terminal domain-containing protein [Undibacterium amnicola]